MSERPFLRVVHAWRRLLRGVAASFAVAAAGCGTGEAPFEQEYAAPAAVAPARDAPPAPVEAANMTATMYDDGRACPGGCDAHVVFHPDHNGAANAFAPPIDSRGSPQRCRSGEDCVICFAAAAESCMLARYRGSGPPRGRFDFTPAFFESRCGDAGVPAAFSEVCRSIESAISSLGYDRRINCLDAGTEDSRCETLIGAAREAQESDAAERDRCLSLGGDAAYNAQQPDASLHRTLGCNYFLNQKGENSAGDAWFKLAPGACRPDTFVGRDGLDCCSASVYATAKLHPECRAFFLEPQSE